MSEDDAAGALVLYGTSACHLCETAEALLRRTGAGQGGAALRSVDISSSEALMQRYNIRIPVLRRGDGAELDWPFDEQALRRFLGHDTRW